MVVLGGDSIDTILKVVLCIRGLPGSSDSKASSYNVGGLGSIPGSGRSPGEGNGNPLLYSCLEKFHGWRSLVGYSPWGPKELGMTERLHFHLCVPVYLENNFSPFINPVYLIFYFDF